MNGAGRQLFRGARLGYRWIGDQHPRGAVLGAQITTGDAHDVVGCDRADGGQVVVDTPPIAGDLVLPELDRLVEERIRAEEELRLDAVLRLFELARSRWDRLDACELACQRGFGGRRRLPRQW